jgi:alcohol dehydrogenase
MDNMKKIILLNPTRLVFGLGCVKDFIQDYQDLGHKRMFLITIPSMVNQLKEELAFLNSAGVTVKINTEVLGEPTLGDFDKLLLEARAFNADSIVSVGGGSVMDIGKLIAAQLNNKQTTDEVLGIGNLKERKTYLACIPTTSGTGSEVSPNAIFVDTKGAKVGVISPHLVPDAAYVDPSLTVSVPASITAATGLDALTHCIEAYTNKFAHPIIDLIALEGVRLISRFLQRSYNNGQDLEARSQVALGSLYGGMCLGPVNTAAVHALSYPLGVEFHIAHGLSNAILLPYVMEFNLIADPKRYADLAIALGVEVGTSHEETARAGIQVIRNLIKNCGIPSSLAEINIPFDAIERMATGAQQVQRLLKNNIRVIKLKDAENIYRSAFNVSTI